jgi:hypothetical protein
MASILSSVKDPAWWFTAVIVAVFAGVVSGFAKDLLERRFSIFIAWSSRQRQEARKRRNAAVQAWSSSEGLISIAVLQTIYWSLATIGCGILGALFMVFLSLKHRAPGLGIVSNFTPVEVVALFFVFGGFFQLSARVMVLIGKTNEAMRKFRQRENLPAFGPEFN